MSIYDIDELKDELEELTLQEKRERLEDIQTEIGSEIEELEAAYSEIGDMLSAVQDEIDRGYAEEIQTALEEVNAAHEGRYLLSNNTLDIEGPHFRFNRWDEMKGNML